MWPLTQKCSLWFAVFARIVMYMPCISRLNELGICSNSSGYPCKKNLHPFKRLRLSMQKKLASVRTAWVIRAKKICIRSNGLGYPWEKRCHPFKKIVIRSNSSSYLFKTVIIVSHGFDFTWAVHDLVARAGVTWQTCLIITRFIQD